MTTALPAMFDFFEFTKTSKVPAKKVLTKNAQAGDKARFFFSVNLELPTDKRVTMDKVYSTMTVKQLKLQIETETGLPGLVCVDGNVLFQGIDDFEGL